MTIDFASAKTKLIKSRKQKVFDLVMYRTVSRDGTETYSYRLKNHGGTSGHIYAESLLYVVKDIMEYSGDPYDIIAAFEDIFYNNKLDDDY